MLSVASRTTLHSILTCKILSQEHQYNIEQDFSCAMLSGASRTTLHKVSPLQYCSRSIKTTLYWIFSWAALPKYVWDNSAQENYLWNVGPERTVIFSQEDNLHNVVLTCLGQYCKDPQSTNNFTQANNLQFCLDLSEPTLHKEVTCAMLVHGWQCLWGKYPIQCCVDHAGTTLRQNIIYSMFSRYVWDKNYLCNVGPERTDIFSQKNRS